jgi:predicted acylesterase/phospholipase RssA
MSSPAGMHKKRSLILAGGGLKVAFQAGVLQVWLDEAGLSFDHADGASGGVLNLAMYCQGMSGTQIADNWRHLPPLLYADLNIKEYPKLFWGDSLLKLDRFRSHVFPYWHIDWERIRACGREATFNVYNFTRQELEVLTPAMMTEDFLLAAISLPMWFPPVVVHDNVYIDAVYVTDANLEEAIRRGADELWVVWTVSEKGLWEPGFVANYFQIIEAAANGRFKQIVQRIEANNAALQAGQAGEFGRHIELKLLQAEVPLHYLINLSEDRMQEAVNLGVQLAREWCKTQGIPLIYEGGSVVIDPTALRFTEEMKGHIAFGETDYDLGRREGIQNGTALMVHLTIKIDGVHRFVTDPQHAATVDGYVECDALGGKLPVERGWFNLFLDEGDPTQKRMLYRLYFNDSVGHPVTLSGFKVIHNDDHFDVWADTTTLFTRILQGYVEPGAEDKAEVVAAGIIAIHFFDFLTELTTFRVEAPTPVARAAALSEFSLFFLGKLSSSMFHSVLEC